MELAKMAMELLALISYIVVSGGMPILSETNSWSVRSVATDDVRFVQLSGTQWLKKDRLGLQSFQEVFRDPTSIKLVADDGSQVLFDFSRGGIFTSREALESTQLLYVNRELKHGTAYHRVTGPELKLVSYDTGAFVQVQTDLWIENSAEGGTQTYRERHRDAWSVYLTSSDNRFVQLDVHTMEIWSTGPGNAPRTLRQRIKSTAKEDSGWERTTAATPILSKTHPWGVRSVATDDIRYVQLSGTQWLGKDGLGQQSFQEVFRDLTSIKLIAQDGSQVLFDFARGGIFTKTDPGDIFADRRDDLESTELLYINRELTHGTAYHRVKGPELKLVTYDDGAFVQVHKDLWIENNAEGTQTYRERLRDAWSVYLTSSDNRFVQLDVHTMEIWSTGPGNLPRTLRHMITSTAKADKHDLRRRNRHRNLLAYELPQGTYGARPRPDTSLVCGPDPSWLEWIISGFDVPRCTLSGRVVTCDPPLIAKWRRCVCPEDRVFTDDTCLPAIPNKVNTFGFTDTEPSYYDTFKLSYRWRFNQRPPVASNTRKGLKLTKNSLKALKGYSVGTCFIGDVILATSTIYMNPVVALTTGEWTTEFVCDPPKLKLGVTDMPNFPVIDRSDPEQYPSHLELLLQLNLYTVDSVDDNLFDEANKGIGFFVQKIGEYSFLVGYSSRSLNTKKFLYDGSKICGRSRLNNPNNPRCYPTQDWHDSIRGELEKAFTRGRHHSI